jgi:hypothetical protein
MNVPAFTAEDAERAEDSKEKNRVWDLMFVGPLGDLRALRVMNGPSHAKNAKVAKDCKGKNRVRDLMFVGPLGDLAALRVMNGPSHAKKPGSL